jgi:hypothetical protein
VLSLGSRLTLMARAKRPPLLRDSCPTLPAYLGSSPERATSTMQAVLSSKACVAARPVQSRTAARRSSAK